MDILYSTCGEFGKGEAVSGRVGSAHHAILVGEAHPTKNTKSAGYIRGWRRRENNPTRALAARTYSIPTTAVTRHNAF
jgi:hypothetical protein